MSDRRIHSINWSKGQTDGDIVNGSVRRVLNAEIDRHDRLVSRDVYADTSDSVIGEKLIPIGHSSGAADTDIREIILTSTSVKIVTVGETRELDLPFTIDVEASNVDVAAGAILINSISSSGEKLGTVILSSIGGAIRFSPTKWAEGTPMDAMQEDITEGWAIQSFEPVAPELFDVETTVDGFHDMSEDITFGSALDEHGVILFLMPTEDPAGGYGTTYSSDYAVQFVYRGEIMSDLSDPVRANGSFDTSGDIGVSVAVSPTLNSSIIGVNVYRKRADGENADSEYQFLYRADVEIAEAPEYSSLGGDVFGWHLNNFMGFDNSNVQSHFRAYERDGASSDYEYVKQVQEYPYRDFTYRTNGWVRFGNAVIYMHDHYYGTGRYRIYFETDMVSTGAVSYGLGRSGCHLISSRFNTQQIADVLISDGAQGLCGTVNIEGPGFDSLRITTKRSSRNYFDVGYRRGNEDNDVFILNSGDTFNGYVSIEETSIGVSGQFPSTQTRNILCAFRDVGSPGQATYGTITGVSLDLSVDVKMSYARLIGGRVLGLNVETESKSYPGRLMWSEYRKLSEFSKSSYNDFSDRDDSAGVCISYYKGKILCHMETATHIMDISGGSDLSWRMVGSYDTYGILHKDAFVETPMGVVWADYNDVYLFDGSRIHRLAGHRQDGISVEATYDQYVSDGIERLIYFGGKNQVWVISGSNALVLDLDGLRWHEHEMVEIPSGSSIVDVYDYAGVDTLFVSNNNVIERWQPDTIAIHADFRWGLSTGEIDLGYPEISKKMKRVYVHAVRTGGSNGPIMDIEAGADGSFRDPFVLRVDGKVNKLSASSRGRSLSINAYTKLGGDPWTGYLDSLGLSYKPRRVK